MKLKEYIKSTERTWNLQEDSTLNLEHAMLGLVDEVGELASAFKKKIGYGKELDVVNIKEEIGDCLYFISRLLETCKFEKADNLYEEYEKISLLRKYSEEELEKIKASTLVDIIQSLIAITNEIYFSLYKGEPDKLAKASGDYYSALNSICVYFDTTMVECMQLNIDKLKTRYPEKFEEDKAVNRDVEEERKTLEKE